MPDPDDEPQPRAAQRNLESMSRGELVEYIAELQSEILRVDAELRKKEAHASAASSFFKDGT